MKDIYKKNINKYLEIIFLSSRFISLIYLHLFGLISIV